MNQNRRLVVEYYLARAVQTFKDAESLSQTSSWNSAMNRLYYACFYAVQAALQQKIELTAKSHAGVRNLFNLHLVRPGLIETEMSSLYSLLMQRRGESDYTAFEDLQEEDVLPFLEPAREFIDALKKISEERA